LRLRPKVSEYFTVAMAPTHFFLSPLIGLLTILTTQIHAAEIVLAWNANPEADVVGYQVFFGPESGSYSQQANVGDSTEINLINLEPGQTYYAVVVAYSDDGIGSPYSDEISFIAAPSSTLPLEPYASISNISPSASTTGLEMVLTGNVGTVATVQQSSNLKDWEDGPSYTLGNTPITVEAPQSDSTAHLYYRVIFE